MTPLPATVFPFTNMFTRAALLVCLVAACVSVSAQTRADYLTPAEVDKIRNTEEPNRKIALFLEFAADRLKKLEDRLSKAGKNPEDSYDELAVRFDDYIRAVDDTTGHLEMWLDRGGVELLKLRKRMRKDGAKFLERLAIIGESRTLRETDLTYELEDSIEATNDMLALGRKIPDGLIPPNSGGTRSQSTAAPSIRQAGKPTLRRSGEDETGRKKEDKKPPPL